MTKGILNSMNTKIARYKIHIQTSPTNEDVHSRLKNEYTEYRSSKITKKYSRSKAFILLEIICHSQEWHSKDMDRN